MLTLAVGGLVAYVAILAALYAFQRQLIYLPDRARPEAARTGIAGLGEVELVTADGLRLLAWYLPPAAADAPVVAYFHGNGGHIGYRLDYLSGFAAAGWGVLLPEYRGYGGNPGSPSEAGLVADARAALAFLRAQAIAPERMVLFGESLGTGVAVQMASETPAMALALQSPYTSLAVLAKTQFPFAPVDLLLKDRFDSLARIGGIKMPILVVQAGRDEAIPARISRALYDAAPEPKEIWVAPNAGHNNLASHGAIEATIAFVQRLRR
jgi:uncharacterized protein